MIKVATQEEMPRVRDVEELLCPFPGRYSSSNLWLWIFGFVLLAFVLFLGNFVMFACGQKERERDEVEWRGRFRRTWARGKNVIKIHYTTMLK